MEACLPAIYLGGNGREAASLARYWARLGVGEGPCTQILFLRKAELGFFHFLAIVTCWLVPSAGQKIPVQPGSYLPPQKIPLVMMHYNFFTHSLCK